MGIDERVAREKFSHSEDDVLANSYKLKGIFCHTTSSVTMERLQIDFDSYLSEIKYKKILEVGCGRGEFSLSLLRLGALHVSGIDISSVYINEAIESAQAQEAEKKYDFKVIDVHQLEYESSSYDIVLGNGILHHLDLDRSLSEIKRVLVPGGIAIFKEPLAGNPFLKLFRFLTPRARTVDERPLTTVDLERIASQWKVHNQYYGMLSAPIAVLTSLILRPFPRNIFLSLADRCEAKLNKLSKLHSYNQYVLLVLEKR